MQSLQKLKQKYLCGEAGHAISKMFADQATKRQKSVVYQPNKWKLLDGPRSVLYIKTVKNNPQWEMNQVNLLSDSSACLSTRPLIQSCSIWWKKNALWKLKQNSLCCKQVMQSGNWVPARWLKYYIWWFKCEVRWATGAPSLVWCYILKAELNWMLARLQMNKNAEP